MYAMTYTCRNRDLCPNRKVVQDHTRYTRILIYGAISFDVQLIFDEFLNLVYDIMFFTMYNQHVSLVLVI